MSSINAVGGARSAWADISSSRASAMKEKMFAKADKDGNGGVDRTELQGMLDQVAEKSGTSLGSADELLGKMDSDGNGNLSQDELDTGMKSLMPAPSSTLAVAQQRSGAGTSAADGLFSALDADSSGGLNADELNSLIDKVAKASSSDDESTPSSVSAAADAAVFDTLDEDGDGSIGKTESGAATTHQPDGPPPGGAMPPPPPSNASSAGRGGSSPSASGSSSTSTDPLDTNEDGVVSAQERATGELNDLVKALTGAADTDGDKQVSRTEATSFMSQLRSALDATTATQTAGDSSSSAGVSSSSGPQGRFSLSALRDLVRAEYGKAAENHAQTPAFDVAA